MPTGDKKDTAGPFRELFAVFARESDRSSWLQINTNRQKLLTLAVESGIRFGIDDFSWLYREYKGSFWLGAEPASWYRLAIESKNRSAYLSWEQHFGITPYRFFDLRLAPGHALFWEGEAAIVTSIDEEHLIACAYHTKAKGASKVRRRFSITYADLKTEERRIRALVDESLRDLNTFRAESFAAHVAAMEQLVARCQTMPTVRRELQRQIPNKAPEPIAMRYEAERGLSLYQTHNGRISTRLGSYATAELIASEIQKTRAKGHGYPDPQSVYDAIVVRQVEARLAS